MTPWPYYATPPHTHIQTCTGPNLFLHWWSQRSAQLFPKLSARPWFWWHTHNHSYQVKRKKTHIHTNVLKRVIKSPSLLFSRDGKRVNKQTIFWDNEVWESSLWEEPEDSLAREFSSLDRPLFLKATSLVNVHVIHRLKAWVDPSVKNLFLENRLLPSPFPLSPRVTLKILKGIHPTINWIQPCH